MSGTILEKASSKVSKGAVERRRAKAEFNYYPQHDDELQLEEDDIIEILGEEEEGWWRGILKGVVGVFPSNFVVELPPSPKNSSDSGFNTPTNQDTPSTEKKVNMPKKPPPPPPPSYHWAGEAPSIPPRPVRDQAIVMYPYQAQNEDELTLKEGDIITVISKEAEDVGWWRGEINGAVGLFPDNFVELLPLQDTPNKSKPDSKFYAVPFTPEAQSKKQPETPVLKKVPCEEKPTRPPLPPHKKPSKKPERLSVTSNTSQIAPLPSINHPLVSTTVGSKENEDLDVLVTNTEQLSHITRPKGPNRRPPSHSQRAGEANGQLEEEKPSKNPITSTSPSGIKVLPSIVIPVVLKPVDIDKKSSMVVNPAENVPAFVSLPCPTLPCPPPPSTQEVPTPPEDKPFLVDDIVTKVDNSTQHNATVSIEEFQKVQDEVATLKTEMELLRSNFKKQLYAIMTEVDEEKKLRLELQVQLERIKTLMTTV